MSKTALLSKWKFYRMTTRPNSNGTKVRYYWVQICKLIGMKGTTSHSIVARWNWLWLSKRFKMNIHVYLTGANCRNCTRTRRKTHIHGNWCSMCNGRWWVQWSCRCRQFLIWDSPSMTLTWWSYIDLMQTVKVWQYYCMLPFVFVYLCAYWLWIVPNKNNQWSALWQLSTTQHTER